MIGDVSGKPRGAPRPGAAAGGGEERDGVPVGIAETGLEADSINTVARRPGSRGSTQRLAELAGSTPATSIEEVVRRLAAIRDHATNTSVLGENDGIAAFTKLYHIITRRVGEMVESGEFRSSPFLVRLDIEFAERFFQALRSYAEDIHTAPGVWRARVTRSAPRPCTGPNGPRGGSSGW